MPRKVGSRSTVRSREDEGQSRCWRVMRYLTENGGGFNIPQLCMTAEVSENMARHYVKALERSGHMRKVGQCMSGHAGSYDTWRLVRYTGPDAPIIHRNRKGVYDPNTKTHHEQEECHAGCR